MAGCGDGLIIGRQLAVIRAGPVYRPVCCHPPAVPILKVAAGEGGLGRAGGGGGVAGHSKVWEGGAIGPVLKHKVVQRYVAVLPLPALHLDVHLDSR